MTSGRGNVQKALPALGLSSATVLGDKLASVNLPWTRLPLIFDPAGLRADLESIPAAAWVPHPNAQDYQGQWTSVALRSKSGSSGDIAPWGAAKEFCDTPLAAERRHLQAAVDAFEFEKKSVRLLRLHAASQVRERRAADLGLAHGELRIYIPVAASNDVELVAAERRLVMRAGEAWFIELSQSQRMANRGADDCVHLVIDGVMNEWAIALLERAAREIVTETSEPSGAASFRAFREMVFEDAGLQAKLLAITRLDLFLEAVVSAGAECGCRFDRADVESALNRSRHDWMMRTVSL